MRRIVYGLGIFIFGSVTCIAYAVAFAFYIGIFILLITEVWAGWIWAFPWLFFGLPISLLLMSLVSLPIRGVGMLLMYLARGPEDRAGVDKSKDKTFTKLVKALQNEDTAVRNEAAAALIEIAGINDVASPPFCRLLWDKNAGVRDSAIFVISEINPPLKEEAVAFTEALTNNEKNVRRNAAITLGERYGRSPIILLGGIALRDKNPDVRMYAAEALGEIGPNADTKEMVPFLTQALKDKDKNVREAADEALKKIKE